MLKVTMNPTPTGYTSPDGTGHAVAEFILTGISAALVEQAAHAHFYGIHADGQTAADARRELSKEISGYLDAHFPGYTAFNILRAEPEVTDGEPTPYRARILVEIDYLIDVTTETTFTGKSGETVIIQRYGRDDYAAVVGDGSVRGTLLQVLQEIADEIPEGAF